MRLINLNKIRNLPSGFIIFLLLALIFEGILFCIPEYMLLSIPYGRESVRFKGEMAERENSYDIIISGDCTGWAGIRPLVLEERLDISAYNFSVDVAQTYMINYIVLARYLSNCARKPELVILQLSPISLLGNHYLDMDALRSSIFPYFRVDSDLLKEIAILEMESPFHYLTFQVLSSIPSFKKQYALRRGPWHIFSLLRAFRRTVYEKYLNFYRDEKGFFNEDMDPTKEIVAEITDVPPEYRLFARSSYNCHYIDKILSLLREEEIPTVVCLTPVRSDEMKIWARYNLRERLNNLLRPKMEEYDNVLAFWDMTDIASNPQYFADQAHLTLRGATIFTEELAKRIGELGVRKNTPTR
jgi:hypothetical protein